MRFVKARREKERFSRRVLLLHQPQDRADIAPITRARTVTRQHKRRGPSITATRLARAIPRLDRRHLLGVLRGVIFIKIPRSRVAHFGIMKNFAHARAEIPALTEKLRQHHRLGQRLARRRGQHIHAAGLGPTPAKKRHPTRIAQRILAIRAIKPHTARRKPIDAGRLHARVAVTAERGIQIIDNNQ